GHPGAGRRRRCARGERVTLRPGGRRLDRGPRARRAVGGRARGGERIRERSREVRPAPAVRRGEALWLRPRAVGVRAARVREREERVGRLASPLHARSHDRVRDGERPLGVPLVVQLQAGRGVHVAAPHAALHLGPVPGRVAAPQRIVRGLGARLRPEIGLLETAQQRARLVAVALLQLASVLRGVRPPGGVGLHLGYGVPLMLERLRSGDRRWLLPPVLHLEARRGGLHGEGDGRALLHFLPFRRLGFAPGDREGYETEGADARYAHHASWGESTTDGVGFEPTKRLPVYTLSRRVPSAARPPIQQTR